MELMKWLRARSSPRRPRYSDIAWTSRVFTSTVQMQLLVNLIVADKIGDGDDIYDDDDGIVIKTWLEPYRWGQGRWPAEREKHVAELPVAPTAGTRIVNCHYSSSLMICDLYRRRTKNSEIPQRRVLTIWLNVSTMIRWYGNGDRFGEISSQSIKKLLPWALWR